MILEQAREPFIRSDGWWLVKAEVLGDREVAAGEDPCQTDSNDKE
jgi:hypothetical protein